MFSLALVFLFSFVSLSQQADLWQHVGGFAPIHLKAYVPTQSELARIKKSLTARVKLDNWPCAEMDDTDWTENLKFEELPISTTEKTVLVEAGSGCARGGQGSKWSNVGAPVSWRKLFFYCDTTIAVQRLAVCNSGDLQSWISRFGSWLAYERERRWVNILPF